MINCENSEEFPMASMHPLDPRMEARIATVRNESLVEEPEHVSGSELRREFGSSRVVSWWSEDPAAARAAADRFSVPSVAASLADLIDRVDAVLVCTKHASTHYAIAKAAIAAGRHVFVDKPFTSSYEEAASLIEMAEAAGVVLMSSSPWRFAPVVRKLKTQLATLGEVRSVVCSAPAIDGPFYLTHSADVVDELVGPGLLSAMLWPGRIHDAILMEYQNGVRGLINGMRETGWFRHVAVFGERGYVEAEITNRQRDFGKVELVRRFVNGASRREPPLEPERMLDVMRVLSAPKVTATVLGALRPRDGREGP